MIIKFSNWSILGFIVGGIFALLSAIRYFIIYLDPFKAITFIAIGFTICGFAWVHDQLLKHGNTVTAIEDYLADKQEGRR